jgi:hypothetical protein
MKHMVTKKRTGILLLDASKLGYRKIKTISISDPIVVKRVESEMILAGLATATPMATKLILLSLQIIELTRTNKGNMSAKSLHSYTETLINHTIGYSVGTAQEDELIRKLISIEDGAE